MADGRLARVTGDGGALRFEVMRPDGLVEGGVDLPSDYDWLTIGFQPSPNTITMAGRHVGECDRSNWQLRWEAKVLDMESWKSREIARGYFPMEPGRYPRTFSRPYPIGAPATRVFVGRDSSLNWWDPATDQLEELVPGYEWSENL